MTFTKVRSTWSPGTKLKASEVDALDGNISNSLDKRSGETNTVESVNTFSAANQFTAGLTVSGGNLVSLTGLYTNSDPVYTSPPLKTLFLPPSKFTYWYTTAACTTTSLVMSATTAAKQSIVSKPETSLDPEQASIALPPVPYFKVYYYNNAAVQNKNHMYMLDLSEINEGSYINTITMHYIPYGYAIEPLNSSERVVFGLYKTAAISSITALTTAATSIAAVVDSGTYASSTKQDKSFGADLAEIKSNLSTYMVNINTGSYSGTTTACAMLFLGATVTYTKYSIQ